MAASFEWAEIQTSFWLSTSTWWDSEEEAHADLHAGTPGHFFNSLLTFISIPCLPLSWERNTAIHWVPPCSHWDWGFLPVSIQLAPGLLKFLYVAWLEAFYCYTWRVSTTPFQARTHGEQCPWISSGGLKRGWPLFQLVCFRNFSVKAVQWFLLCDYFGRRGSLGQAF